MISNATGTPEYRLSIVEAQLFVGRVKLKTGHIPRGLYNYIDVLPKIITHKAVNSTVIGPYEIYRGPYLPNLVRVLLISESRYQGVRTVVF